jgi:hypothetical protein
MKHFTNILVIAIKIYLPDITELGKECLNSDGQKFNQYKKKLTSTSRLKSLNAKKCHDIH